MLSYQVHYGLASNEEYQKWIAKGMKDPGYAAAVLILQHRDENLPQTPEQIKKRFENFLPWYLREAKYGLTSCIAEPMSRGTTPPSLYPYRL